MHCVAMVQQALRFIGGQIRRKRVCAVLPHAAHKGGKASAAAPRRGKHALPAGKKRAFPASGEAFLPAACTLAAQTGKLGIRTLPAALAGRLAAQGADQPAWRDAAGDAPDVLRNGHVRNPPLL